ncbi:MAG: hypothetical protein ABL921_07835 [Pirellula sp.]
MNRSTALLLLSECTGDDLWSIEHCRQRQIPAAWIAELTDAYESGFQSDDSTIYFRGEVVNQFEGIRDVDLACKLGHFLGLNVRRLSATHFSRSALVRAIREAIDED